MPLSVEANEHLYDALAAAIDGVGHENESLFLTKLVLLLANQVGNDAGVGQALKIAASQLTERA